MNVRAIFQVPARWLQHSFFSQRLSQLFPIRTVRCDRLCLQVQNYTLNSAAMRDTIVVIYRSPIYKNFLTTILSRRHTASRAPREQFFITVHRLTPLSLYVVAASQRCIGENDFLHSTKVWRLGAHCLRLTHSSEHGFGGNFAIVCLGEN